MLLSFNTVAKPVSPTEAHKAATQLLSSLGAKEAINLTDITAETPFEEFYVFAMTDRQGFVLIAGDDATEPVLAYSLTSSFPLVGMPDHVRSWLEGYEKEIRHNRKAEARAEIRQQWEDLLEGRTTSNDKASVSPMLTTIWNQSPYYNALCPYDTAAHTRIVCGCTATATAQIMKYFSHPAQGYGTCSYTHNQYGVLSADYGATTYQWADMPDSLTSSSSATEIEAVATLIYHIGVAVSMNYSVNGSGGKTASYGYGGEPSSENAFKYNFKYSPYVWTAFRIDYDLASWKALMKNELNNGRPILYAGYDERQSGHAFVCDGYNNQGLFHFNWGWGGSYDGYYKINNLNPTTSTTATDFHFDLFATATIGIEPYDAFAPGSTTTVNTAVEGINGAAQTDGTVTGGGTYNFGDTITLTATATNAHSKFVQWSDGCRYNPRSTVATGGEISFTAQFAPLMDNTVRYHTCDNAMNRASNLPEGLGTDSVWGIKIDATAIKEGSTLYAIRMMGRKAAHHTLTIYTGTDSPDEVVYSDYFYDTLDYDYTFHTHALTEPISLDGTKSLWIALKCTEIDTPGVFSIYGGNPNSMLSGANMEAKPWKFSWMIEGLFNNNVGIATPEHSVSPLAIYPNPAHNTVTVARPANGAATEVAIYDMTGVCRMTATLSASPESTIDISTLPNGIYIVRSTSGDTVQSARLIVKH